MGAAVLGPGRGAWAAEREDIKKAELWEGPRPGARTWGCCSLRSCWMLVLGKVRVLLVLARSRKHTKAATSATPTRTPVTMLATAPTGRPGAFSSETVIVLTVIVLRPVAELWARQA